MANKKLNRRDFLRLSAVTAAGVALAACRKEKATEAPVPTEAPAEAPTTEPPMAEEVELTIWTFGSFFTDFYDQIFPDYKEIAPHVTMKVEEIQGSQMFDNLLAAFAAGSGAPDIPDIEQGSMSRFFKGEIGLIDLTDVVKPYEDDFVMARTDPYSFQGKIYGIDHCLCPCALFYRWDLFEEAGIGEPPTTWQEFAEVGGKLQDVGAAAISFSDRGWGDIHMLFMQKGTGGIFDENSEVVVDSDEHVEVLSWYADMINSGVAMPTPPEGLYAVLGDGGIASQIGADWFGGFIRLNVAEAGKGKWKAAPFPVFEEGGFRTAAAGGTGYTITKQSAAPEEAWKFIEFALFDADNKYLEFTVNDLLPPIKSMLSDERYLKPDDFYSGQSIGELYLDLSDEMPRHYRSPFFAEATTLLSDAVFEAVVEGKDAAAALGDMAEELRATIDAG